MSYFEDVHTFHKTYGLDVQDEPIDFTHENDDPKDTELFNLRNALHQEEWNEYQGAWQDEDLVGLVDATADLIYVLLGTMVSFGIPFDQCWKEVQRSNMSKLQADGSVLRRADGKILKGENFTPPDLRSIIYDT